MNDIPVWSIEYILPVALVIITGVLMLGLVLAYEGYKSWLVSFLLGSAMAVLVITAYVPAQLLPQWIRVSYLIVWVTFIKRADLVEKLATVIAKHRPTFLSWRRSGQQEYASELDSFFDSGIDEYFGGKRA